MSTGKLRLLLASAIAALACLAFAGIAMANNLDRRTATNYAKQIAKYECNNTTGCSQYYVRKMKKVSRHKAWGKIAIAGNDQRGRDYVCVYRVIIKLSHATGELNYGISDRKCYV